MRRVPLAWLQLTREKRRFAAALAGITFAVVLMLVQLGLRAVLYLAATRIPDHLTGELVMINPQYEYLYALRSFSHRRLYSALSVEAVESVAPLYVSMGTWKAPSSFEEHQIFVIGVPADRDVLDLPAVHDQLAQLRVSDAVLFDTGSRPEFGPAADLYRKRPELFTEVNGHRVRVVGLFDLGATFGAGGHLLTSDSNFSRLFHRPLGLIDIGVIRLRPGANAEAVRDELARVLPSDVVVLTRQEFAARERDYWARRAAIGFIFDLGSVMGLLVGSVIVYQVLYTDVTDHLDEYATLKAVGYRDRFLFGVILREALVLGVFGFVPGYAIAELTYAVARSQAHVPIAMTLGRAASVFVLTVSMCGAAGAIAMSKLRYADPAEIF